jgi:hypothetical protein
MTQVVQIIAGYGRQDFAALPDSPVERARMRVDGETQARIEKELHNLRLPGYSGLPSTEGQIFYDYRHSPECHLVAFDDERAPWLVRVSASGVFAMPLPTIPATTTQAFREFVEDKGDDEILTILDRFGGMPSGESFPEEERDFEAWRRAGVIVKVCDASDFYSHQMMYFACGWSVNSDGWEGYNTCRGTDARGIDQAYGYKMRLALATASGAGKLPENWVTDDAIQNAELTGILSEIYRNSGDSPSGLAVKYKLRRYTASEIISMSRGKSGASLMNYWDALEAPPIAAHSGGIRQVAEGNLYWPRRMPRPYGAIKFPDYTGSNLESMGISQEYAGPAPRCDTVVWGGYVNDELRTIRYFYDDRTFQKETQSDFEEPMIVGSWEEIVTEGPSALHGNCYTNDFDDRADRSNSETSRKLAGRDLGYGGENWWTPAPLHTEGLLARNRFYEHEWTTGESSGNALDSGALVPVFTRDCLFYAAEEASSKTKTVSSQKLRMEDPTAYDWWTYDFVFHWIGRRGEGEPYPRDSAPVWMDNMSYAEFPGSWFADSGNWFGFNGNYQDVTAYVFKYLPRGNTTGNAPPRTEPGWRPVSSESNENTHKGRVDVNIKGPGKATAHRRIPDNHYFRPSPDEYGDTMYRDAAWIAIGAAEYASIFETTPEGERISWGQTTLVKNPSTLYFIGVVNE